MQTHTSDARMRQYRSKEKYASIPSPSSPDIRRRFDEVNIVLRFLFSEHINVLIQLAMYMSLFRNI
jgi:hypothetical protein